MAYGIRFQNSLGVSFFDGNYPCYSVKETGSTALLSAVRSAMGPSPVAAGNLWDLIATNRYNTYGYSLCDPQIAASALRYANFGSGFYGVLPVNVGDDDIHDLAFYRLSANRIVGAASIAIDLPDPAIPVSTAHIVFEASNSPIEYKIITTNNTNPKTGNYGMKVFNSAGGVIFDSRDDLISVRHAVRVTRAELLSIMKTGSTRTITLPETSDWWVCLPDFMPFCWFLNGGPSGGWYDRRMSFVSVRQISPTQVLLERNIGPSYWQQNQNPDTQTVESANDITLLFARNIP